MRTQVATFSVEVPEGWQDQSMATFLMPPRPLDPRILQQAQGSPGNVSVSRVPARGSSLEEFLRAQEPLLAQMGREYRVENRRESDGCLSYTATFSQGETQLSHTVIVRTLEDHHLLVVGTALLPFAQEVEEAAWQCARSLRVVDA